MWSLLCTTLFSIFLFLSVLSGSALGWTSEEWRAVVSSMLGIHSVEVATMPDSSDICDNCRGKGKVGDGTVSVTCAACDGTGKKKKSNEKDQEVLTDKSASTFRGCTQFT